MHASIRLKRITILVVLIGMFFFANYHIFGRDHGGSHDEFMLQPLTQGYSSVQDRKDAPSYDLVSSLLQQMPAPERFRRLDLVKEPYTKIQEKCRDTYIVLLVFAKGVDYRKNPSAAQLNQAFSCQKGNTFSHAISIRDLPLFAEEYYLIVADQGETGNWYNPR